MKNVSENSPGLKMQSDLEEGEIPDCEVSPSAFRRNNKRMLIGSRKVHSLTPLRTHDKIKKGSKRYCSPPSEDEYIYEEEKLARRNRIVQKNLYNSNLMGKAPKNLHSMQPTYGSLEVIMTKIGESLGRHSDYYYKERRPKESRYLIAINDSRNINSVLRETSPVLKKFGYNYHNKRRYSETNSESVDNIREKYGKTKCKKSCDGRRSGNDVSKKRKRERSEINESSTDKKSKIFPIFEETEKGTSEQKKKPKIHGLDTKFFKDIPLPQEQEPEPEEKNVQQLPNSDLNCLVENPKDSLSQMVEEGTLVNPPSADGDSAMINSADKPERLNDKDKDEEEQDDDDEDDDDDDDDDLIKLRLLALTSNKKKSQSFTNNCLGTAKKVENSTEENAISESKYSEADDEKTKENPSSSNDETVKECRFDNEIDRYELFLRAEALKTALLKKHQRILKKMKNFSSNSRKKEVIGSESSNGANLNKRKEMDMDIISDEELLEKNIDDDFDAQLEVTENYEKPEIRDVSTFDSETSKEDRTTYIHQGNGLHSKKIAIAVNTSHYEESSLAAESSTPESDKTLNDVKINLENASVRPQSVKKKTKRTKAKQSKKTVDFNETDIKKNNEACEKEDLYEGTKSGYSLCSSDKNKVDSEQKFILVDTVALSNSEINATSHISNNQMSLEAKQNHTSIVTQKPTPSTNDEPAAKIPESERIIVHLGSDSSDEEPVHSIHPHKKSRAVESEEVKPFVSAEKEDKIKEFEKSVEILLRGARRKLENSAELTSDIPTTPEAVYSHLAPSQRLEYIRLKQKIAEREKTGKVKKNNLNNPSVAEKSKSRANSSENKTISPKIIPRNIEKKTIFGPNVRDNKATQIFKNRVTHNEVRSISDKNYAIRAPNYSSFVNSKSSRMNQFSKIKKPVPELNSLGGSASTLKKDLKDSNSKSTIKKTPSDIIIERKKMLNQNRLHLERLKMLWKNIKIEKMVEAKYEREIKKLKIQQNFFELKINQQRLKIKRMADESKEIYEAFQKNNKRVELYSKKKRIVAKLENEGKRTQDSDKATTEKTDSKDKDVAEDREIRKDVEEDREIRKDVEEDREIRKDVAEDKESTKEIEKEVTPIRVENDVRVKAKDAKIGVNEKREDVGTKTEENIDKEKNNTKLAVTITEKDWLKEYRSPLENLTMRSESSDCRRIDPNVIMCQYDLLGKCNDEECVFQHWRA